MKPQYSKYDLLGLAFALLVILAGYLIVGWPSGKSTGGTTQKASLTNSDNTADAIDLERNHAAMTPETNNESSPVILARKLNRWVQCKYPQLRTRIRRKIYRFKRSVLDDT